jgi:hypothetical protein
MGIIKIRENYFSDTDPRSNILTQVNQTGLEIKDDIRRATIQSKQDMDKLTAMVKY